MHAEPYAYRKKQEEAAAVACLGDRLAACLLRLLHTGGYTQPAKSGQVAWSVEALARRDGSIDCRRSLLILNLNCRCSYDHLDERVDVLTALMACAVAESIYTPVDRIHDEPQRFLQAMRRQLR